MTNHPGMSERVDPIDEIQTESPSRSSPDREDSPERGESHDDDLELNAETTSNDGTIEEEGLISSRLDRVRNPPDRFAYAVTIPTPTSAFFLYIGSGAPRDGDLQSEMKKLGGPIVVNIDLKVGGYDHDITYKGVQDAVLKLARHPNCAGVFVSIPCKTFSVLRGRPGVENSYPLRDLDQVLGIPREDGTLPRKVIESNAMSDFTAKVMTIVHNLGGVFVAESPPSRAAGSRFPIEGRERHASQFDHPAWVRTRERTKAQLIYFDQCPLYDDPASTAPKKTAFMVNPKGYHAFYHRFAPLVCNHEFKAHRVSYGLDEKGRFTSPSTETYPPRMNALIARALMEACKSEVSMAAPLARWKDFFETPGVTWPQQRDVADYPTSTRMIHAAAPFLGNHFSSKFYASSIDNQLFAAPREIDSDNPTYRQARASANWPDWERACEDEIQNLKRNGTIDDDQAIPEDSLPSWNSAKKSASEVVNILWVLRVKYNDGKFEKFKARAVFDGRDQKAKNPELETFSPACRTTTQKLITAEACRLGHRLRTWDVEAAYLKGVFDEGSKPLFGRPPPGYRTYVNGIPMIWKLNTPLYGEADAGRIWYKTLVKFLIEDRGFTQSRYDPCFLWKELEDGSRLNCVIYVDDGYSSDNGSKFADYELEAINVRFNIKIKDASFFLGNNINCISRSSVSLTSRAYIARIAEKYLPRELKLYPTYVTPCDKTIVSAYEEALSLREKTRASAGRAFLEKYASKVGALIYVVPVCRVDCAFTIGVLARCLTFPTEAMDAAADRCLVYLAQNPDVGLLYDADTPRPELHAYSDSNWTVGHSTSG